MTNVRIEFDENGMLSAMRKANAKALRRAGAYVRKTAVNAVSRSSKASQPGTPPNTRKGLLKRSILFGVDKERQAVVIGPAKSLIGISMIAHEFGGMYRRRKYPKRPLMGPSLLKAAPQLSRLWENALKP